MTTGLRKSVALLLAAATIMLLAGFGQNHSADEEIATFQDVAALVTGQEQNAEPDSKPQEAGQPAEADPEPAEEPVAEQKRAEPEFYYGMLPDQYYQECPEQGEAFSARTEKGDYVTVYLPYGYTEDRAYNVLIIIPGLNEWCTSAVTSTFRSSYYDGDIIGRRIYDWAIYKGLCEPMIICSVNAPNTFQPRFMAYQLKEGILPYITGHYSTYAEDSSFEALKEARQHFALAGCSQGSGYVYAIGLGDYMFDAIGNFVCIAGEYGLSETAEETINQKKFADLPIYCLYTACGSRDVYNLRDGEKGFHTIVDSTDRLEEGENAFLHTIDGSHLWPTWFTGIFNAMQVIFLDRETG